MAGASRPRGAYDDAIFGSGAATWLNDGLLLARLEADQPTDVVIALGTNDVTGLRRSGWAVVEDLMALYHQAETFTLPTGGHPRAFVATIPPVYDPPDPTGWKYSSGDVAAFDVQVRSANAFLRMRLPVDRSSTSTHGCRRPGGRAGSGPRTMGSTSGVTPTLCDRRRWRLRCREGPTPRDAAAL